MQNGTVTGVGDMLRRLLDGMYLFAGYAAGAFLVLIFAIMMVMSVGRQFQLNIPAGDDFASWCMAASASVPYQSCEALDGIPPVAPWGS